MLKNNDIFNFDFLEEQTNQHGKGAVTIQLILKLNNLKFYQTELEKDTEILEEHYQYILSYTKKFINLKKFKQEMDAKAILEDIKKHYSKVLDIFHSHIEETPPKIQEKLDEINFEIMQEKLNIKKLEKNISQSIDLLEFNLERIKKTYEGIEKLDNKKLKCVVRFNINGFETNFTKYYLNLEEYGDILNNLVKSEINKKFFLDYKKLENDFLDTSDILNSPENIKVKDLISITQNLLDKLKTIESLNIFFLNAQKKYESIKHNYESSLDILEEITQKYLTIFKIIQNETHDAQDSFNSIYFFENIDLEKFLSLSEENIKNCIPFLKKSNIKKHSQQILLLPIINYFDTQLANQIKSNIIKQAASEKKYSRQNSKDGYFLKKSVRQTYTNNRFYSHEISEYKFYEEKDFKNHKYSNKFVDKIPTSKSIKSFSGVVSSNFFKKDLMYQTYMTFKDSRINLKNYEEIINKVS